MTVQEAYNKILPLLEYYIVADLFTAQGTKEQAFLNDSSIEKQINEITSSMPYELSDAEIIELNRRLLTEGKNIFNYFDTNINALSKRKEDLDIALPTLVEEAPELWADILDQSRMTDAEREYEEWIQSQAGVAEILGNDLSQEQIQIAVANLMTGQFYGISGNPAIGRRDISGSGTIPLFTYGMETNLYSDPHIQKNGQTWLQDVQLRLIELGLLGDYVGQEDRTIFTPNQLDQATINALEDLMGTLNRSGQYLPGASQLLKDMTELGLDTGAFETALGSGDSATISQFFADVASSNDAKKLFHNYLIQGADKLIKDKKRMGADMQIIITPSYEARMADAKSQWFSLTGSMMNPYLAAVAAQEVGKIYEDVQMSEGKYMGAFGLASSIYKKAQQDRVAANAPSSVVKPMSDPLQLIEQKITETISKMAIEDNAAFSEGSTQRNYGTNLWALLSSLG